MTPNPNPSPELIAAVEKLTRPIIGMENRTPLEVRDILFDRIRSHFAALSPQTLPAPGEVDRNLEAQRQAIEACARIADNHAEPTDTPDDFTQGYERAAGRIARSIRKLCPNATLATVAAANDEGVARIEFVARVLWADGQRRLKQGQSDLPRTRTDFRDAARALLDHPALATSRPQHEGAGK